MQLPLQISFRHMEPSDAMEQAIREKVGKLETKYSDITSCRVVVEQQHQHATQGNLFTIRIDITVPGKELVVNHDSSDKHAHEDAYVTLRDAFEAMRRQLDEYTDRKRGDVKKHQ